MNCRTAVPSGKGGAALADKAFSIHDPYAVRGTWRRAQLHCHTNRSDGALPPQEAVRRYRRAGFDVLCITDHYRVTDISALDGEGMLLVHGVERTFRRSVWPLGPHLLCLGDFTSLAQEADSPCQTGIAAAAHPTWNGNLGSGRWSVASLVRHRGIRLLEIRNPHSSPEADRRCWLEAVAARGAGEPLWGTAVDDMHRAEQIGRGWVEVRMESLDLRSFIASLRAGAFYMSSGPQADFRLEGGLLAADGGEDTVFSALDATGRVRAEAGGSLRYAPRGDEEFVVLQGRDAAGGWVCSQPFWLRHETQGEFAGEG